MKQKLTLPTQYEGVKKDVSHSKRFKSIAAAKTCFQRAKNKLIDINHWAEIAGSGSATFQLTSDSGQPLDRVAEIGDYIKIDLPAPKLKEGKGYDWVLIEKIEEAYDDKNDSEGIMVVVRPIQQPFDDTNATSHFFDSDTTSSFLIERKRTVVTASEHGRNEIINLKNKNVLDKIRNFFVALGAILGLSEVQWKKLIKGLLR